MKRKSYQKKKKEEIDITIEVGIFDDFIIIDKIEPDKKKEEKNDLYFLEDRAIVENIFFEKTKYKSKKSRFSDLFEQLKEEEKKSKEEE